MVAFMPTFRSNSAPWASGFKRHVLTFHTTYMQVHGCTKTGAEAVENGRTHAEEGKGGGTGGTTGQGDQPMDGGQKEESVVANEVLATNQSISFFFGAGEGQASRSVFSALFFSALTSSSLHDIILLRRMTPSTRATKGASAGIRNKNPHMQQFHEIRKEFEKKKMQLRTSLSADAPASGSALQAARQQKKRDM